MRNFYASLLFLFALTNSAAFAEEPPREAPARPPVVLSLFERDAQLEFNATVSRRAYLYVWKTSRTTGRRELLFPAPERGAVSGASGNVRAGDVKFTRNKSDAEETFDVYARILPKPSVWYLGLDPERSWSSELIIAGVYDAGALPLKPVATIGEDAQK